MIEIQTLERPQTVGEMVVADHRKAEVFRKFGIDYCCGGKKPLEDVCRSKGINVQTVQAELDLLDAQPDTDHQDFHTWEADELAEYIVAKHHQYVENALPILQELTAKVARVHGDRHPELLQIRLVFSKLAEELTAHLQKEERILFPYVAHLAGAQRLQQRPTPPMFGTVGNPVQMMEHEHDDAGQDMAEIRRLSNEYTPPADACTSYRVLYAKLEEFERDLHQHVHLENNILFPAAMALEKQVG
ncbi:MAG: iron-sulfur cluster repair di-iron protein [Saprospiraceae bacterium]|nr:iron-sulfur cluster repair di-iron protein [Saprospiraceae bacterium]